MPLNIDSGTRCGDLLCVESDGFLAITPAHVQLTDVGWQTSLVTLQEHADLSAVMVSQATDLLGAIFTETWTALPNRLASLAIHPPTMTCLVARSCDAIQRALRHASDTPPLSLWHCLVEFAKGDTRIALQQSSENDKFVSSQGIISENWLPELLSSPPRHELDWLFGELKLVRLSDLCGEAVSQADATAVLAGLWLLHGDADASHRQSQSIEDEGRHRCGNFWHAIMHRQEPDYGNSKYWFRRVGQHPIFPELARRADEMIAADVSNAARHWQVKLGLPGRWDPFAFVDWCEAAAREAEARQINLIRRIQFVEMHLLLQASFRDATRGLAEK